MTCGLVPAFDNIHVDTILAILYFDKAAAKVKPPSNSIITEDHIAPKMNFDADSGSILLPSSDFNTPKMTIKSGTSNEVTNNGIASVAHNKDEQISRAKQFRCSGCSKGENLSKINVRTIIEVKLATLPLKIFSEAACSSSSPTRTSLEFFFLATYAFCALRSKPIMSFQTVFRSQTTCSLKCNLSSDLAFSIEPLVAKLAYIVTN
ncbi:hypothetical protein WICMUC_003654 [Wickerhamomyces mucosus]|uniref:Uncharacterized protein n=1 Tax=Wickerhamomyces mucosus TaxID=1378264 RepID=A0A9P8PK30_9ASCO|nr:hypothetical protein WICMUC_003654 [Wickerhamomyces mucosus]